MLNRREMLSIAGAAVALSATQRADAAPPATKPDPGLPAAANACALAAEACVHHCITMLEAGNTSMAGCLKQAMDLAPTARALSLVAVGSSTHLAALAAVVGQIAKDCKAECDKHLAMPPCKACADSCAALIAKIG